MVGVGGRGGNGGGGRGGGLSTDSLPTICLCPPPLASFRWVLRWFTIVLALVDVIPVAPPGVLNPTQAIGYVWRWDDAYGAVS